MTIRISFRVCPQPLHGINCYQGVLRDAPSNTDRPPLWVCGHHHKASVTDAKLCSQNEYLRRTERREHAS